MVALPLPCASSGHRLLAPVFVQSELGAASLIDCCATRPLVLGARSTRRPQPPIGGAPADASRLGADDGPAEPRHQQGLLVAEMVWAGLLVDHRAGI